MTKQFNIRSEKAHKLAVEWSERTGKSLAQVVEDALVRYDAKNAADEAELWGPILHETQEAFRKSKIKFEIEDLYDPETGLSC